MAPHQDDCIEIAGLRVTTRIGVPDEERANDQELMVDLRLVPLRAFSEMTDEIDSTVDYAAVAARVSALAAARPRKLIETLADEIVTDLLRSNPVRQIDVTIRKFILPNTDFVAVRCSRRRIA